MVAFSPVSYGPHDCLRKEGWNGAGVWQSGGVARPLMRVKDAIYPIENNYYFRFRNTAFPRLRRNSGKNVNVAAGDRNKAARRGERSDALMHPYIPFKLFFLLFISALFRDDDAQAMPRDGAGAKPDLPATDAPDGPDGRDQLPGMEDVVAGKPAAGMGPGAPLTGGVVGDDVEGETTGGAMGPPDPVAGEGGHLSGLGDLLDDLLAGEGLLEPVDDLLADAAEATVDVAADVYGGGVIAGDLSIAATDHADGGIADALLGDGGQSGGVLTVAATGDQPLAVGAQAEAQAVLDLSTGGEAAVTDPAPGVDLHFGGDAVAAEVMADVAVDFAVQPLVEIGIESDLVLGADVFSGLKTVATVDLDFADGGLLEERQITVGGAAEGGQSAPARLALGLDGALDLFPELQGDGHGMAEDGHDLGAGSGVPVASAGLDVGLGGVAKLDLSVMCGLDDLPLIPIRCEEDCPEADEAEDDLLFFL
jgi:hypothetical protein